MFVVYVEGLAPPDTRVLAPGCEYAARCNSICSLSLETRRRELRMVMVGR